ncbi:MAG TPA: hemolysin family protein [Bacteroidota bacterium]
MLNSLLEIALVLFFVLLNGFFVAAEFAIVKVRSTQIDPLVAKRNLRAVIAKDIVTHLDAYLSATQLGITMASLALGWVGEPFVADALRDPLQNLGIQNPQVVQAVSFGVAFGIITFLHIVLGELAPKSLAIQKALRTTLFISYPLKLFFVVFKPIIWALNSLANAILRVAGISAVSESEMAHSQEELRLLLAQDKEASAVSKALVLNAMDFRRKQARHAMVSRRDMIALSLAVPAAENLQVMRNNKFSRYPVYRETIDNIVGIIHTKDIFKHERHLQAGFSIDSVLRDAAFLPETVSLERALETMLQKKAHMVILADEYGGTAGLITLENILEELVGTIQDEFDREAPEVTKLSDSEYVVDASITTNDVERLLNQEFSSKDILSIGAFITEQLGHIPRKGEKLKVNGAEFIVEEVGDNAVEKVRVKKV